MIYTKSRRSDALRVAKEQLGSTATVLGKRKAETEPQLSPDVYPTRRETRSMTKQVATDVTGTG